MGNPSKNISSPNIIHVRYTLTYNIPEGTPNVGKYTFTSMLLGSCLSSSSSFVCAEGTFLLIFFSPETKNDPPDIFLKTDSNLMTKKWRQGRLER